MKTFSILLVSFLCGIPAIGQQALSDSGFTNKKEAKNLIVNGLKEGKWKENVYMQDGIKPTPISGEYCLIVYKGGKPDGMIRQYDENPYGKDILEYEIPYVNGIINGVQKYYYRDGLLRRESPYENGQINGVEREWYDTGIILHEPRHGKVTLIHNDKIIIKSERTYKGKLDAYKEYWENGNLECESSYGCGPYKDGVIRWYYESGQLEEEDTYKKGCELPTYKYYKKRGNYKPETVNLNEVNASDSSITLHKYPKPPPPQKGVRIINHKVDTTSKK